MGYLTKSRFKLARECPRKLFYTKKKEYANKKNDDSFMESLAEGGFQVGELAKCYFPEGHDITELGYEQPVEQTNQLMIMDDVTIYEAAIKHDALFIRADILVKNANIIDLVEVKAKSFNLRTHDGFFNSKGNIKGGWKPYLEDIAFQTYVTRKAFPDYKVHPYLMLADKNAESPTSGLNQKFRIVEGSDGRKSVEIRDITDEDLSIPILTKVDVSKEVEHILNSNDVVKEFAWSFKEAITNFSQAYSSDDRLNGRIGSRCKSCEFRCSSTDYDIGLKSGFDECWKGKVGQERVKATVLDIWNFRKIDEFIEEGIFLLDQIEEEDIEPEYREYSALTTKQRQWLQVEKEQTGDATAYLNRQGLKNEIQSWIYPLHFIDFETSTAAIPFIKGMSPYETIAFQFSHHQVEEDGTVTHKDEFLNAVPGVFPNYEFVRALKGALEGDSGSIFMFAPHENTVLNHIIKQLIEDPKPPRDADELVAFLKTITRSGGSSPGKWNGQRSMIDMCNLVKKFYYDPYTKGSNSIKKVLPAVLHSSEYLQSKYSQPIYGASNGILSKNFKNQTWFIRDSASVTDPYKLLADGSNKNDDMVINSGGDALTAYSYLQYSDLLKEQREYLTSSLLRYCELDTLAMVMIYEAWKSWLDD